jgi:hypothetical protein
MRIIEFIKEFQEINKIRGSLGIEKYRAPPPILEYSSHDESIFHDFFHDFIPDYA